MSSTRRHNMVNVGPVTAEIVSGVLGTPANLNGFRVVASLLQPRRWMEVNQTLHDVWPSPRVVHHIYTFSGLLPGAKFTLFPNLAFSYTGIRALGVSQTLWRNRGGQRGGSCSRAQQVRGRKTAWPKMFFELWKFTLKGVILPQTAIFGCFNSSPCHRPTGQGVRLSTDLSLPSVRGRANSVPILNRLLERLNRFGCKRP